MHVASIIIPLILLYCLLMILLVNRFVNKQRKILRKQEIEFDDTFYPYIRNDYKKWSKIEMYFCAIFLLLPRIIIIFWILVFGLINVYLLSFLFCIKNFVYQQNKVFKWITRRLINISCRILLLCFGFWWIKKKKLKNIDGSSQKELDKCNVIISNHVSFMDILYILTFYNIPSIIAKSSVKNIPFIGKFAQIIQCIFIDRKSKDSKLGAINSIKKRVEDINNGHNFSEIFIFPEGTTSNGETIYQFKRGAFILDEKIKIMVFDYRGRKSFNPAYNLIGLGSCLLLQLLHVYSNLKVTYLDIIIDPKKFNLTNDENCTQLSNYARELINIYGNYELTNGNYNGKFKAEKFLDSRLEFDN